MEIVELRVSDCGFKSDNPDFSFSIFIVGICLDVVWTELAMVV